jgi:hypothetical protein
MRPTKRANYFEQQFTRMLAIEHRTSQNVHLTLIEECVKCVPDKQRLLHIYISARLREWNYARTKNDFNVVESTQIQTERHLRKEHGSKRKSLMERRKAVNYQ